MSSPMTFQDIILAPVQLWAEQVCVVLQPYDSEVAAVRSTRQRPCVPWARRLAHRIRAASRRPTDGPLRREPNRCSTTTDQVHPQASPDDVLDLYFDSLRAIGVEPAQHDVRLVEDDWSPRRWVHGRVEVWLNGMEVTQFTYFQQVVRVELPSVPAEISTGSKRLEYTSSVDSWYDITWYVGPDGLKFTYGDVFLRNEQPSNSAYNFEVADERCSVELFADI